MKYNQTIDKKDVTSTTTDIIMELDREDRAKKEIPIAHYFMDMRYMLISLKIAKLTKSGAKDLDELEFAPYSIEGLSEYQLSQFLATEN